MTLAASPMACFFTSSDTLHGLPNGSGQYGGSKAGPSDACNPVTAAGCPDDGSTCDFDSNSMTFACYPPPNSVDVCGTCDNDTAFCGAELTCVIPYGDPTGVCFRYCCTDADCGSGATCDTALAAGYLKPSVPGDKVGLCVQDNAAACGAATPKSGGSCVAGYNPGGATTSSNTSGGTGGGRGHGGGGHGGGASTGNGGGAAGTGGSRADGGALTSSASGTGGAGVVHRPPPDGGSAGRGTDGGGTGGGGQAK